MNSFLEMSQIARLSSDLPEYAMLFQEIHYPSYISSEAVDLISNLLNVKDSLRLGSGPRGFEDVKRHPFFRDVDWDLLQQKHVIPPYIPPADFDPMGKSAYLDFETIMKDLGKHKWLTDTPPPEDDKYFAPW